VPRTPPKRPRLRRAAIAAAVVVAALGVGCGGVHFHRKARAVSLAATVDAASRPLLFECRWERPVVGGPGRDCNGAEAANAAAGRLMTGAPKDATSYSALLDALENDRTPSEEVQTFLADRGAPLAELRDSVRCSWACLRDSPAFSSWSRHASAVALLVVTARAAPPEACLATAVDALRLVEDRASGAQGTLFGRGSLDTRLLHEARRTLVRCAAAAPPDVVSGAARDTATVAKTPPPVGDAVALMALESAASLVDHVLAPGQTGADNVLWVQRGGFLDEAQELLARVDTYRGYRDAELPAAIGRLGRDTPAPAWVPFANYKSAEWASSAGQILAATLSELRSVLDGHTHADRDLRLAAVAVAAERDRVAAGAWPEQGPAERVDPALCDPFTGAPFVWSVRPGGPVLLAEAMGEADAETVELAEPARLNP
jgi:hypothetical protein